LFCAQLETELGAFAPTCPKAAAACAQLRATLERTQAALRTSGPRLTPALDALLLAERLAPLWAATRAAREALAAQLKSLQEALKDAQRGGVVTVEPRFVEKLVAVYRAKTARRTVLNLDVPTPHDSAV
jgi:hypothetical protein